MMKKFTHEVWNLQKSLHNLSKMAKKFPQNQTCVNLCKLGPKFTQACPPMLSQLSSHMLVHTGMYLVHTSMYLFVSSTYWYILSTCSFILVCTRLWGHCDVATSQSESRASGNCFSRKLFNLSLNVVHTCFYQVQPSTCHAIVWYCYKPT